jgi:hypothetical protein
MIQHAVDSFGRLDCLFNTAGDPSVRSGIAVKIKEEFSVPAGV